MSVRAARIQRERAARVLYAARARRWHDLLDEVSTAPAHDQLQQPPAQDGVGLPILSVARWLLALPLT